MRYDKISYIAYATRAIFIEIFINTFILFMFFATIAVVFNDEGFEILLNIIMVLAPNYYIYVITGKYFNLSKNLTKKINNTKDGFVKEFTYLTNTVFSFTMVFIALPNPDGKITRINEVDFNEVASLLSYIDLLFILSLEIYTDCIIVAFVGIALIAIEFTKEKIKSN